MLLLFTSLDLLTKKLCHLFRCRLSCSETSDLEQQAETEFQGVTSPPLSKDIMLHNIFVLLNIL